MSNSPYGEPYGAMPPPPPGPPGGGGFPPLPPFPPPPGGGSSKLPLIIGAAVVGVLALAGAAVLLLVLLSGGDDDDKSSDDPTGSETPAVSGDSPDEVVTKVLDAAKDDDCDSATGLLTENAKADDPCSSDEFEALASGAVEFEVGFPQTGEDFATVPVEFMGPDGGESYVFALKLTDGEWLVDQWLSGPEPSDDATDPTDDSTDPTGPTTGAAPTQPGGSSTASAVPNEPEAVTKAFMDSVLDGDCATALDLVTDKYKNQANGCSGAAPPSGLGDQITITTGRAVTSGDKATVPVTIEALGQKSSAKASLVKEDGQWKVNDIVDKP